MKKFSLVMVLAMLFSLIFLGILQAGQCIYLGKVGDIYYYYDSSSVRYSGDIVSFDIYDNAACKETWISPFTAEIDCARRMHRTQDPENGKWESWESFTTGTPGSPIDTARIKLCR